MCALLNWLDQRLDYRRHIALLRRRVLPNGPSWWSTSASCLMWLLLIECITGLLLMSTYSPSMASAWASVNFTDQSAAGRFLRGVHHYSSHALIILFGLHLVRVVITGAYRAPRELVWITGLLLFPLILVWTVTGNPLASSQKGIAQIQVEGNILAATPFVGPWFQRILFGGRDIGNLTLTRLHFLHVGLLPLLVGGLFLLHLHQVIKHSSYRPGVAADQAPLKPLLHYWPYQSVRNMTMLVLLVGTISGISWQWGAPLSAPADPELPFSPRPEWYFRWLFELRRHFTGDTEFVATMVVPAAFLAAFMLLPFLDRLLSTRFDRLCRLLVVVACAAGWGWLTYLSFDRDWNDPEYIASMVEFERLSERARELARSEAMPVAGAVELLRHDPQTQGPRLFARHCSSCHTMTDADDNGMTVAESSAPNLRGIGTATWIVGFFDLDQISGKNYFGNTAFHDGEMKQHIQTLFAENDRSALQEQFRTVAVALAAEAGHEVYESAEAQRGRSLIVGKLRCTDCHQFHNQGSLGSAPDLTGYASTEWLTGLISNPSSRRFYGDRNDRMPAFAADSAHPEFNLLSTLELDLLVKWLTGLPGDSNLAHSQKANNPAQPPASHPQPHEVAVKTELQATP